MPDHPRGHRRGTALRTVGKAAELLRAPVATLRSWGPLGNGPAGFHLGRLLVYRRADLHAWIDARRLAGDTPGGGPVPGR